MACRARRSPAVPRVLLALLVASFPPLRAVAAVAEPAGPRLVDRVAAVVNDEPILASEIDQVIGLGLVRRGPGETDGELRRRALDGLIDQSLRFQEIGRFGFEQVPVDRIEQQVAKIRSGFASDEDFQARLRELGLTAKEVDQLVARQLAVLTFVEERLGPRVFVSLDDIREYYDNTLVPHLEVEGAQVPPLEDVREQIRGVLKERRLNEEIERWTAKLRRDADIEILIDDYPAELPPVVERFAAPAPPLDP